MASSKNYLTFVLEQLSDLSDISYRAMMGDTNCPMKEQKESASKK